MKMNSSAEMDEDKIDMEMVDVDLNVKYENVEKNGSLFSKPFCNGNKKKDYDQDTIYSIPVVQDTPADKDQYSPNQPKTPSSLKEFSALYASIANDFKRKKSTTKSTESGINDGGEGFGGSSKEDPPSEEKVETIVLTSTTTDPETLFAKSIVEGDQEGVQGYLKTIRSPVAIATMRLSTQNLDISANDETSLTPIDLAVASKQEENLDILFDYCLTKIPEFEQHLKDSGSPYSGAVFDKLVAKNPKVAEEYLNLHLDSVNASEAEMALLRFHSAVKIDFTPFNKVNSVSDSQESLSIYKMLQEGNIELIKHPVTETFIRLKWQKLNWLFYLSLFARILFASLTTTSILLSFEENSSNAKRYKLIQKVNFMWAMLASYIPLFVMYALSIIRNWKRYFIRYKIPFSINFGNNRIRKVISISIPNCRFVIQITTPFLLIAYITIIEIYPKEHQASISHLAVWLVFFPWMEVICKLGESPCIGIYIYLLTRAAQEVTLFLSSLVFLLTAFGSVSFLLFESVYGFRQVLYSTFNMIAGSFEFIQFSTFKKGLEAQDDASLPGTTEVIFLLAFIVLTICSFNILVGLTIMTVKDVFQSKENFELGQMITNTFEIEDTMDYISNIFSKFGCSRHCITKPFQLLKNDDDMLICVPMDYKTKLGNPRHNLLCSNFREIQSQKLTVCIQNATSSSLVSYAASTYHVPIHIVANARTLIDEKEDSKKCHSGKENQEDANPDGYTSLYFNGDRSENDYEEVDQEKYNAMKSIKESIMRELRKDLGRFVKSDKASLGPEKNAKCVSVRPGLAMGVITLQAGARGDRITLT